jgi:hypothetical protein
MATIGIIGKAAQRLAINGVKIEGLAKAGVTAARKGAIGSSTEGIAGDVMLETSAPGVWVLAVNVIMGTSGANILQQVANAQSAGGGAFECTWEIEGAKITGFGVITTQGTFDGGEASSVMTWAIDVAETAPPKKTPGVILFAG